MKLRVGILLIFFIAGIVSYSFAFSPQEKIFEGTVVKMGTSTENIMPLLANIAGNWKGYLKSISGQYRGNYMLIEMVTNKTTYDIEEIRKKAKDTLKNSVMVFYPKSEGMISVEVSDSVCIAFEYSEGHIQDKSIIFKSKGKE